MSKKREMCSGYCSGLTLNYAGRREKMISKILNDLIREWMQSHVCYECEGDTSKKNINILVKGILNLYDDKEGLENMEREDV